MDERVVEPLVLLARQGAVQIVAFPIVDTTGSGGRSSPWWRAGSRPGARGAQTSVPSRLAEHPAAVNRFREDYRADRIVKVQMVAANESGDVGRQSRGGERARRDDDRRRVARRGDRRDLLASDRDPWMVLECSCDGIGEALTVHGQ